MNDVPARLRLARILNGLSVKDAAVLLRSAGLNISVKTLYNWETGQRSPDADEFLTICDAYGINTFEQFDSLSAEHGKDEVELLRKFRALSDDAKSRIINAIDFEYKMAKEKMSN